MKRIIIILLIGANLYYCYVGQTVGPIIFTVFMFWVRPWLWNKVKGILPRFYTKSYEELEEEFK